MNASVHKGSTEGIANRPPNPAMSSLAKTAASVRRFTTRTVASVPLDTPGSTANAMWTNARPILVKMVSGSNRILHLENVCNLVQYC